MYIDFIHDKPHSLFHVPSLRANVVDHTIEKSLLCSILALSVRFSSHGSVRSLGDKLALQARQLLKAELEEITISKIQAWILLGNVAGFTADSSFEALYFGLAIRCAQIIGLAAVEPGDTAVNRETKSRIWWTLYMIDRWASAGLGIPRQMGERQPSQQLPFDEWAFHGLPIQQAEWLTVPQPGMWAYMITLAELFGSIHDMNKLLAVHGVDPAETQTSVETLSNALEDWQRGLPESLRLSHETLELHRRRDQGRHCLCSMMRTLTRTLSACSALSLLTNHLGLSGRNQIPTNWMKGIRACRPTGIRHAASPAYFNVPNTVQAAIIDPTYQRVLYIVVSFPLCCGWASCDHCQHAVESNLVKEADVPP